ncbi:efflux RND transporter periplasmic adaptor subunit [Planktotalea arctica]|uniref:efflux RND transporter periplasmic adaptor subunit n=1 Tax=Planktotalea arctica TaxID=1481893 RepID=UPI00321B3B68
MERASAASTQEVQIASKTSDLIERLQTWCEDVQKRLPGLLEVGLLRLDGDAAGKIAAAPDTMPVERVGYREAVARARASNVAVLLPLDRPEDSIAEVIAMPVRGPGLDTPVFLLVGVGEMPASRIQLIIAQLEVSLGWVLHYLTIDSMAQTTRQMEIHEQAFLLCAEMLDTETPIEARQTLASLVGKYLQCDRVALVHQGVLGLKIQSISGETRFDRKSRINDLTRQAAHEAQLRRAPVRWNRDKPDKTSIIGRLAEMHGDACALAVPLTNAKGKIDEVIVLHWASEEAVPDLKAWSVLWTLARPILEQKDIAARGAIVRSLHATKQGLKRLFGPRAFKMKLLVSALIITALVLTFGRVENTLRADVVIDDPDLRVISAPVDGFLDEVFVIPGDAVTIDQPLLKLEDSEIRLRIAELDAQIARHTARAAVARANRDRAEAAVADAERAEAEARRALALRELDQTVIVSRTAGIILEGDLRQRVGARVTFGEELLRIAPRQGIELQLSVRNRDGDLLEKGLLGRVRLDSAPQTALNVIVTRIKPGAETIDGELKFVAFGELQSNTANIENGIQGSARLDLGQAPVYQVWVKPIVETIYMFLWRWMP